MVTSPCQALQGHERFAPREGMGEMTDTKLGGNEPGIDPIVFGGVQVMRLLEFLDETGIKDIDIFVEDAKIQVAVDVHGRVSRIAPRVFQAKQDLLKAMLLHKIRSCNSRIPGRLLVMLNRLRGRFSSSRVRQQTTLLSLPTSIPTNKGEVISITSFA